MALPVPTVEGLRPRVLSAIAEERSQQLLFLETVRDAATLAGEQVQDKRLDFIENPPDVSASDVLLDMLVSLALGKAASVFVRAFAERGARCVLAFRPPLSGRNGIFRLRPFSSKSVEEGNARLQKQVRSLLEEKDRFEYWRTFAEEVIDVPVKRITKKAEDAFGKPNVSARGDAPRPVGDTAGVAVRRSAFAFSRLQAATVERVFAAYEDQARSDDVTVGELASLGKMLAEAGDMRRQETNLKNEDAERALSLFFESCIWLLHFGGTRGVQLATTEDATLPTGFAGYGTFRSIPGRLLVPDTPVLKYWLRRLPHPNGDGLQSLLEYESRGHPTSGDLGRAVEAMMAWFESIEGGLSRIQLKLKDKGLQPMQSFKLAPD